MEQNVTNIHDNNNPNVPTSGTAGLAPIGTGMVLAGGRNDTVINNKITNQGAWGILVVPFPDSTDGAPAVAHCIGGEDKNGFSCYYDPFGHEIAKNTFKYLKGFTPFGNVTNGIVVVLGSEACGLTESARVVHYLAGQSAGQCGPCVYGLPAIADDLARLARGDVDPSLLTRLDRRVGQVDGRGACRHPDGAANLVRSALAVFADDVRAHARGAPCAHWNRATLLRFPTPRLVARA